MRLLLVAIVSIFLIPGVGAQTADSALLTELIGRVERLQNELASVRGENERLRHELEQFKRETGETLKQLQTGTELDSASDAPRVDVAGGDTESVVPNDTETKAEAEGSAADMTTAIPSGEAVAEPESTEGTSATPAGEEAAMTMPMANIGTAISDTATEEQEYFSYRNAMQPLEDADYAKARKRFAQFLQKYPQGKYAADAKYWVAESYYVANNYELAERYYKQVIGDHKNHRMHDEALLRIASIREARAEWDGARVVLQKLNSESKDKKIRTLAQKRLERLAREGR